MILRFLALAVVGTALLVSRPQVGGNASAVIPFEAEFKAICGPDLWLWRACQIRAESAFNPNARSFDGGQGLGQATGGAWPWYKRMGWVPKDSTPFQPVPAITGAHKHMNWATAQVGSMRAGWCAYNAGVPAIRTAQKLAKIGHLPAPMTESFLTVLPQVTHANAQYTIRYDRNIRDFHTGYLAAGLK